MCRALHDLGKASIIKSTMSKRVTPRRPSGFPEYLPAEQLAFDGMLAKIRESYASAGFLPIETPALELSEVLLAKGGGETEQEVFRFGKGSKDYVLHYDLTVPLARYVAEHQNELIFPFRRSQIQKVWRAERAQKGRSREFYQCDADVVGESDVAVDGEMIALAADVMRRLDVGQFVLRVNNRKILTGLYESLGVADRATELLRIIDKLEKVGEETVQGMLEEAGLDTMQVHTLLKVAELRGAVEPILAELRKLTGDNATFTTGITELERTIHSAMACGVAESELEIDCSIARGLDYYTSTVFETVLTGMPELGSVCSGGRFDNLAQYYTDRSLPGVGISVGVTRLFDGLRSAGRLKTTNHTTSRVIIAPLEESAWELAGQLATSLRDEGIACELSLAETKLAKVFSRADKLGVPFVAVIGEKEMAAGVVALKDMSSGSQSEVDIIDVSARVR